MKASSVIKKVTAAGLALCLLAGMTACGKDSTESTDKQTTAATQAVYTETPGSVTKKETVYVNIDNTGSVQDVQVTDWLHTDKGQVCVDDISNLNDITNIKTDINPVVTENGLQWNMPDTDLYYSGTTDKKPPVEFQIKYYLDGKEISADDIAGKSGKVKIEVTMKNNCYETVEIDGKEEKVYLPVVAVGGLIMNESEFSGVTVEHGRSIGDGTKEIVVFYGMPGMSESLGLNDLGLTDLEGLVLGSKALVTADATDFEVGNMYFAALPLASLNLKLDNTDSIDDLKSILVALSEVQETIADLDTDSLIKVLSGNTEAISELSSAMIDAVELYNSNKALIDVLTKYATPENSEQLRKLLNLLTSEDSQKAISMLTDSTVINFLASLSELSDSLPILSSLAKDLQTDEVMLAIKNLPETLEKINKLQKALDDNSDLIDTFMSILSEDSIDAITSLMSMVGSSDFTDLAEKYSSVAANSGLIVERAEKWIDFGKEYRLFTEAPDNMETSVTFIYMTPAISKPVDKTSSTEAEEATTESILDTFVKKFK